MAKPQKERAFDEIMNKIGPELKPFSETLQAIYDSVYSAGCIIAPWKNDTSIYRPAGDGHGAMIRLGYVVTQPLNIIWILLHEFGHHYDPEKFDANRQDDISYRYPRELRAWAWADKERQNYPNLLGLSESFNACKEENLGTYIARLAKEA